MDEPTPVSLAVWILVAARVACALDWELSLPSSTLADAKV